MTQTTKPDKKAVRDYLDRRTHEEEPPPSPDDIRRELGWALIPSNRREREEND